MKKRICLDRIQGIFKMKELGKRNREIAEGYRCSASTVSDTLTKYVHPDESIWNGMSCYEKAKYVWDKQKATARGKKRFKGHICNVKKREYVEEALINEEWSPEIISNMMPYEIGETIGVNSIYRYTKKSRPDLKVYLYEKGKPRRQRVTHRRSTLRKRERIEKVYIDQRPDEINSRQEFGHWEGDLVLGPKNGSKYAILSLIERKTRFKYFTKIPNTEAETTLAYLRGFFMNLPSIAVKSITLDNGSEFAVSSMHKLEKIPGFKLYYTQTYSPQQKGSDEHSNGRFRKTFPKKTDFAFISHLQIKKQTHKLNCRPMKLHGYKTPQAMFLQELKFSTFQLAA